MCMDSTSLLLLGWERSSGHLTHGYGRDGWDLVALKSHFLAIPNVILVRSCSGLSWFAPTCSILICNGCYKEDAKQR